MSIESLPRHDVARPVLRLAFTVAWAIGALLAMAIVITVAHAAPDSDAAAKDAEDCATVRQAPEARCLWPTDADATVGARRLR